MTINIEQILHGIEESLGSKDFYDKACEATDALESEANAFDAVEPILRMIENNPDVDFGTPGPLVHFVEKFYKNGYEQKLIESLKRKPSNHTVWMLNRIVNGTNGRQKADYLAVLNNVLFYKELPSDVKELVEHFLSLHV